MSDDYASSVNVSASVDRWQNTNTFQSTDCQTCSHVHQIALGNITNPGTITAPFVCSYPVKRIMLFFVPAAPAVVIIIIIIIAIIIVLIRIIDVA